MGEKIRVPEHVKERLEQESDEREIPMGAVVESWMQTVDRFDATLEVDGER